MRAPLIPSLNKALRAFENMLPMLLGMLLLTSLVFTLLPKGSLHCHWYRSRFLFFTPCNPPH